MGLLQNNVLYIIITEVMISLLVLTLISALIRFCIYFIYRLVSWRNMIKVVKITLIIQQGMVTHKSCCLIQKRIWTCMHLQIMSHIDSVTSKLEADNGSYHCF